MRYTRTFDGLRVIGGDLVVHRLLVGAALFVVIVTAGSAGGLYVIATASH